MTTRRGNFRRLYSVRRRAESRDGHGIRSAYWGERTRVRGEAPRDGSAQIANDAATLRTEATMRLRTPFFEDVEIGDKLVDVSDGTDGDELYVRAVADVDGRRRHLQFVVARFPAEIA